MARRRNLVSLQLWQQEQTARIHKDPKDLVDQSILCSPLPQPSFHRLHLDVKGKMLGLDITTYNSLVIALGGYVYLLP